MSCCSFVDITEPHYSAGEQMQNLTTQAQPGRKAKKGPRRPGHRHQYWIVHMLAVHFLSHLARGFALAQSKRPVERAAALEPHHCCNAFDRQG